MLICSICLSRNLQIKSVQNRQIAGISEDLTPLSKILRCRSYFPFSISPSDPEVTPARLPGGSRGLKTRDDKLIALFLLQMAGLERNVRISVIVAEPGQSGCTANGGHICPAFQAVSYFPWTCRFQEIHIQQLETTRIETPRVQVFFFFS